MNSNYLSLKNTEELEKSLDELDFEIIISKITQQGLDIGITDLLEIIPNC